MNRVLLASVLALLLVPGTLAFGQEKPPVPPEGFDRVSDVPHGAIKLVTYPSRTVGVDRRAVVYTPPGYSEEQKYPVLYLLHGIGGTEWEWVHGGHPEIILDNLIAEKKAVPMVVVMPNGRAMKDDSVGRNPFSREKVEAFANFEQNTVLLAFAFEAFDGFFEVFSISYFYKNHCVSHHLLRSIGQNYYPYIIGYFARKGKHLVGNK